MAEWFLRLGGSSLGPYSSKQFAEMAVDGRLMPTDSIRRGDMVGWAPAAKLQGLSFPPELPPPPVEAVTSVLPSRSPNTEPRPTTERRAMTPASILSTVRSRPSYAVLFALIAASVATASLGPKRSGPLIEEARRLSRAGSVSRAYDVYNQVLNSDPKNSEALARRAGLLVLRGEHSQAIADCNRALVIDRDCLYAYLNLANVYCATGDLASAEKAAKEAVVRHPDNPDAHISLGRVYGMQSRNTESVAELTEAIRLNADDFVSSSAYLQRGLTYRDAEKPDAALADFEKAIALDPDNMTAVLQRGVIRSHKSQLDAALEDFTRVVDVLQSREATLVNRIWLALAHANRSAVYYDLLQVDKAREDCDVALRIDPSCETARKVSDLLGTGGSSKPRSQDLALSRSSPAPSPRSVPPASRSGDGGVYVIRSGFPQAIIQDFRVGNDGLLYDLTTLFYVEDGTTCREDTALVGNDRFVRETYAKVTILDGTYRGKSGWITRKWLR